MARNPFRVIFPNNERQLFDGGLNNKFQKSIIENNESPDCANVIFENRGVETRQGTTKLNTALVGSFACDGLYTRRDRDGSETMCAWFNGDMFTLATTTFTTVPSAQSVFTAGQRVAASQYENHIFVCTGGTDPYKYNGTDFTRHGVPAPTSTMTAATAATGSVLTGDYLYKVTYVNSQAVEGDLGPITGTFAASSENIALTSIPVAPQSFGVNSRRIYRTAAGGASYLRLAEIADNTTTTYEDGVADGGLGTAAPTDNGVPPKYKSIVYHQNRLFMITGTDNKVWYTDLAEPYTVQSTNFLTVGDDSSDLPTSLGVHNDQVVVFGENTHEFIYIPDPASPSGWLQIKGQTNLGCKSPFGIESIDRGLIFPAFDKGNLVGFALISGTNVEKSAAFLTVATAGSDFQSDKIEPDVFLIQEGFVKNISAITFKNKLWITVAYGASQQSNNRVYQYDYNIDDLSRSQRGTWAPFTGDTMHISQFTIYGGELYGATSDDTGFVYKMEDGTYSDDGAAIDSYYWTKEYGGFNADLNFHKDFRYVNALVENAGNYFMDLVYRVDSDQGDGNTVTIDLTPGGSVWGVMEWLTDSWGGGTSEQEAKKPLSGVKGKRIQFKFSNQNTVNQKFRVDGLNFTYNKKGFR